MKINLKPVLLIYLLFATIRIFAFQHLPLYDIWGGGLYPTTFDILPAGYKLITVIILDHANILLMYFLGLVYFNRKTALISSLIYAISMGPLYYILGNLVVVGLVSFCSLLLISIKKFDANICYKVSALVSILLLACISLKAFLFGLLAVLTLLKGNALLKIGLFVFGVVVWSTFLRQEFSGTVIREDFYYLVDIGIVNDVNEFRGILLSEKFSVVSKLIDNKYFYMIRFAIINAFRNLIPVHFFTAQTKMLGFSNNLPIYTVLLAPLCYSIYLLLPKIKPKQWLALLALLPLAFSSFNEINLLLIFPIFAVLIANGLVRLGSNKKLLITVVAILAIQVLVSFSEISTREPERYKDYVQTKNF